MIIQNVITRKAARTFFLRCKSPPENEKTIDEYIERHKETLDLLSRPEWVDIIYRGKEEVSRGVKGKTLDELAD